MPLRITPGMMHMQLTRNLNRTLTEMSKLQEQMTTGRKINRASDDPVGITYALRYRSELSVNEQYQKNVDMALSWLDFNDTVLQQAQDVLKRLKELAVQGSNGTNPDVALNNIADEVIQLKEQIVDIANSTLNGKYVFNGEKTDVIPYDPTVTPFDPSTIETDSGAIYYMVGVGVKLQINLSGNDVFGRPGEADNIFAVFDQIITALQSGNHGGVSAQIANIESRMDKILNQQSEIGARVNRVELMQNRLKDLEINLTDLQSKTEDVDFEKLIIDAKINENIYQASLSVGAKIITPSLVDFLN
ncbi:flagellar hook-associated protein 3 [Thermobacillus composti KWC4]|uniref:Flagellar hook-associated protein 3 n=1 Tax=Thermobacillus composti (strain DSM 18247 / JCM 13945 / KWC4) TaxID=717605 RepID=L0E9G1_THECK|nr:flagellar hook-associated protein FlgL [Thermobacillus composti]AGA56402.1 flagellar hook-associated protein 3 [Thermobacillus composti KWC4]